MIGYWGRAGKKVLAALLACSIVACASVRSSSVPLPPEEQALVQESREIVQRSLFQGAVLGALLGCGIGALVNSDNRGKGCLVGGAVGGVGGAAAGAAVGQGNVQAKRALDKEDEKLAELQQERQRLEAFETKLKQRIADQDAELERLNAEVANKQITAAAYSQRYRQISAFREDVAKNLQSEIKSRSSDKDDLEKAKKQGVDVTNVEAAVDENLESLRALSAITVQIAPPAVPLVTGA